ncbi:hypothetical protein WA158_003888 [Blastocystis sp. Blastoise]
MATLLNYNIQSPLLNTIDGNPILSNTIPTFQYQIPNSYSSFQPQNEIQDISTEVEHQDTHCDTDISSSDAYKQVMNQSVVDVSDKKGSKGYNLKSVYTSHGIEMYANTPNVWDPDNFLFQGITEADYIQSICYT